LLLTTPTLNEEIFKNLPSPLHDGCFVFRDSRERDVFLTGALSVLSGCLDGIDGIYDRRTTFPNLFSFIIAPAASGKSALAFAKQLGDVVHAQLLEENTQAMQQYRQELADYKLLLSSHKKATPYHRNRRNHLSRCSTFPPTLLPPWSSNTCATTAVPASCVKPKRIPSATS
jgi:hypothetical protein